jgi:hypothetical protein
VPEPIHIGSGQRRFPIQILPDGSWIKGGRPVDGSLLYYVMADTIEQAVKLALDESKSKLADLAKLAEKRKSVYSSSGVNIHNRWRQSELEAHIHFSRRSSSRNREAGAAFSIELKGGASIDVELSPEQFLDLMTNHYFKTTAVITRPGAILKEEKDNGVVSDFFITSPQTETVEDLKHRIRDAFLDQEVMDKTLEIAKANNLDHVSIFVERDSNGEDEEDGFRVTVFKT